MGQEIGVCRELWGRLWGGQEGSIRLRGAAGRALLGLWGAMGQAEGFNGALWGSRQGPIGFNGALWGSRQGAIGFNGALWGAPGGSRSRARSCPNARLRFRSVPSSRAFSPRSPRRASPNSKAAPNPAPHTAPHSSANRSAAQRPMAVLGGGGGGGPPRGRDPLGGGYTAPPAGRGGNCSAS